MQKGTLRDTVMWILGRRSRVRIEGNSMQPALQDGQTVLVHPTAYHTRLPLVGDIILARHPIQGDIQMVKRVDQVLPDRRVLIRGDNPGESTDSRSFGALRPEHVLGRVVSTFP